MLTLEIFLLGLGLGVDAAIAAFALGLVGLNIPTPHKWLRGILIAVVLGSFQAMMTWFGSLGGYFFTFSSYGHLFHIIVLLIFLIISLKLIQDSFADEEKDISWGLLSILVLAIATSIDALAAGVSLGTFPEVKGAAILIGLITFALCSLFYALSHFFQNLPYRWLLRVAGIFFLVLMIQTGRHYLFKGVL